MTIKKVTVDNSYATTLLNPSPVTLVTTTYEDKNNVATVSWVSPASFTPNIVAIMVSRGNHSHSMIESSRQFAINIPGLELVNAIKVCGSVSGNSRDKFMEAGLSPFPAIMIDPPLINECFAHIECHLNQSIVVGDHTIFSGNVVSVFVQEGLFAKEGEWDLSVNRPIIHLSKNQYGTVEDITN